MLAEKRKVQKNNLKSNTKLQWKKKKQNTKTIFFLEGRKYILLIRNTAVPEVLVKYEQIQDTYGATLQKQRKKS